MSKIPAVLGAAFAAVLVALMGAGAAFASSHREAPAIANDPSADVTDYYAFRSPDAPSTVTFAMNVYPFEEPSAGPNWYGFSPNALYAFRVDTNGNGRAETSYLFRFRNAPKSETLPLGNTVQTYSVWRVHGSDRVQIAQDLQTAPNNIGPRTNNPPINAGTGVTQLPGGVKVFAGQRDDPFFGDIGAAFDVLALRPSAGIGDHGGGIDAFGGFNVQTIAIQVPIADVKGAGDIVGSWGAVYRRKLGIDDNGGWVQVSRLGNPLVNELLIPTARKDYWNSVGPSGDIQFSKYVRNPALAAVLNQLYNLGIQETNRSDLVHILLTGVNGLNFTGPTRADELRLNVSIDPARTPNRLGVLGGDNAGYPNGRRLGDDVIDITEQALVGALIGNTTPLGDGVDANDKMFLAHFPYVSIPHEGFADSHGTPFPSTS